MPDQNLAAAVEVLVGGASGTFLVCSGVNALVSQKTASEVRTLLGVLTSSEIAAGYQPLDGRLTTIADMDPIHLGFMQFRSGALRVRSLDQVKYDLGLDGYNTGDQDLSTYLTSATAATTYAPIAAGQPTAGTVGQVLTKNSGTNYDSSWTTLVPGDRYLTTSTTSNTISNGNKTFTIGTGLSYTPTQNITISYDASKHMHGEVLTYNSGTGVLSVDINHHTGSGTYAAWVVNVGGVTPATSVAWGDIIGTLGLQSDLATALNGKLEVTTAATTYQPLDSDLTAIAALSPTNDDFVQRKAGVWTNRTVAQVKTDLSLTGTNSGDQDLSSYLTSATAASTYVPVTRTLNTLALSADQTFAVGTTGTDFAIESSGTAHTFNIPDASFTARGLITTGYQVLGGAKDFTDNISAANLSGNNSGDQNLGDYLTIYDAGQTYLTQAAFGDTTLNGIPISDNATFSVVTDGTDFTIVSNSNTHFFYMPDASETARGLIGTGTQTIAGAKTFSGAITASNLSGTNTGDQDLSSYATTSAVADGYVSLSGTNTITGLKTFRVDGAPLSQTFQCYNPSTVNGTQFICQRARGTLAVPLYPTSSDVFVGHYAYGWDESTGAFSTLRGSLACTAAADWTSTGNGTQWTWQTTPTNTKVLANRMRLHADGSLTVGGVTSTGGLVQLVGTNDAATGLGTATNRLRFTDTDNSVLANQPLGEIEFYSGDGSPTSAGVRACFGAYTESTTAATAFVWGLDVSTGSPSEKMRLSSAGKLGLGTGTTISAFAHVIGTTEQLRLGYDVSNYYTTTVSSAGAVTFDAVGASAGFTFSDPVTLSSTSTATGLLTATVGIKTTKTIYQTTETTSTPAGAVTIDLTLNNHQTLALTSVTTTTAVTLTPPTGSSAGTLIVKQHATASKDITTWAVTGGTIKWMGTEPNWVGDAATNLRVVSWRWDGSIMYLAATDVGT